MNRRSAGPTTNATARSPPMITERRAHSTSKLGALFRGEQPENKLQDALQDLAITTKLTLKAAECQRRGAAKLADWARHSRNAAIDDVMAQTENIFQLHGDKMAQFARDYEHFVLQLSKMSDAEKAVSSAEKKVDHLKDQEKRLKKEIRRGPGLFGRRPHSELESLRAKLTEVQQQLEMAERNLSDTRAEMEVVKMFRFRLGMQGIADAYMQYASTAAAIFGCQREITELVPAISTQDVRRLVYDGSPITRERVEHLRRSLESPHEVAKLTQQTSQLVGNPRRRSEPTRVHRREIREREREQQQRMHGTPPPPYTPTAPPQSEVRESSTSSTNSASHLHPIPSANQSSSLLTPPSLTTTPSSRPSHFQPARQTVTSLSPPTAVITPTRPAHLQPIPSQTSSSALAQLAGASSVEMRADRDQRRENRRSLPPCGCSARLYPELPPNPYRSARE